MSDQHKEWEDDGRTVADMSGLDRPPLFGHKEGTSRKKQQEPSDGALALLVGLGLCIWLLTLLLH